MPLVLHSLPRYFVRISQFLCVLVLAGASLLSIPTRTYAQISDADTTAVASASGLSTSSVFDILGTLINVVLGLLGAVFLLLVLYAGFLWMTAGGDEKKVDKARKMLIQATVGLIILLSAYAITTFVINWLSGDGSNGGNGSSSSNGSVSVERLSGALGSGALRDHYPDRNATNVARNTRIMVTFKDAMDIESLIAEYDVNGTPTDTSDDTTATAILSENMSIYKTADGIETALTNVSVTFSDDLKTFVFDPAEYLDSPILPTSYTVYLSPNILDAEGDAVFTDDNSSGYEWSFETGTSIDTTAPTVESVVPAASGKYARNITVQITFDEAVDPTTASGTRKSSGGYDVIQTAGADAIPLEGAYEISNGYTTVTFTSTDACGTNSCGDTIYCLPEEDAISVTAQAATPGVNAPQIDGIADGIADVSGNALDANNDGTAGDDYAWSFFTSGSIELGGPTLLSISPDISEPDVALDQPVSMLFDDVLLVNTVTSDNIIMSNIERSSSASHEMWYRFESTFLDSQGGEVANSSAAASQTLVEIKHGTFLESVDGKTYTYGVTVGDGVKNQYQNCFAPAEGPSSDGGICEGPYCCNGDASASACTLF
jgi:Type IV secretion system pilin/Bacterial Ig-like domain